MDEPFSRLGSFRLVLSLMKVLEWKNVRQAQYPIYTFSIVDWYILVSSTITSSFARPASSRKDPKAQEMQKMKVWNKTITKKTSKNEFDSSSSFSTSALWTEWQWRRDSFYLLVVVLVRILNLQLWQLIAILIVAGDDKLTYISWKNLRRPYRFCFFSFSRFLRLFSSSSSTGWRQGSTASNRRRTAWNTFT